MEFTKIAKNSNTQAVYMRLGNGLHYVHDLIAANTEDAVENNKHGLDLRARLDRSKGEYAMAEGSIFNPFRLIRIVCDITDVIQEDFTGADYKDGYTLLTITADSCVNKYIIYSQTTLQKLLREIENLKKR